MKKLKIDPHSAEPIYQQMISLIVAAIEAGQIEAGEKLPSIRELASQLKINPNTTAKVYRELELRGFVESRPGAGCFVRQLGTQLAAEERSARMQQLFDKLLGEARKHRIDEREFMRFVRMKSGN